MHHGGARTGADALSQGTRCALNSLSPRVFPQNIRVAQMVQCSVFRPFAAREWCCVDLAIKETDHEF